MRITGALAVVLTGAVCGGCTTDLSHDLPEDAANEVVLALAEHGIGATRERERGADTFVVRVLDSDLASSLAVLRDEQLPRAESASLASTFREPGLVPTAGEERARLTAALSGELERTLEALPGVHRARVHVGLPGPSAVPIDELPTTATASVLVTVEPGGSVEDASVRALVAGAVPDLRAEDIRVIVVDPPHAAAPAPLAQLGPIAVTTGSAPLLRALLGVMLSIHAALAVGLVVALRRRSRSR